MSSKEIVKIDCPGCHSKHEIEVWSSINVQLDPEAKRKLLKGKINLLQCADCGHEAIITVDFLYHDMKEKFCVQFIPFDKVDDDEFLHHLNDNGGLNLDLNINKDMLSDYFKNIHLVFSMEELRRYVIFRDRLFKIKKGMENGISACFSCYDRIPVNDIYFCVSRLHRVKGETDNESDYQILDAMSSLQVCAKCVKKAAKEKILFPYAPIPILNLEKNGFHKFAQCYTDKTLEKEPLVNDDGKCLLCQADIKEGDEYTHIELTEELMNPYGKIDVKEFHKLAILCKDCTGEYMV